jgi:tRNA-specific 2-thiouridylase
MSKYNHSKGGGVLDDNKVILGLSGGVDSAVVARRLKEQGFEVSGVYLDMGAEDGISAARTAAAELDIPLEIVDIRDALEHHVCAPFAADYLAGRTPLPCAVCNPTVKFPALLAAADRLGARWVATGHYARTSQGENGRTHLLRGVHTNDQSYLLARLTQEILQRTIFPLGDWEKTVTREQAGSHGLSAADRPDSMEICFIPDDDYPAWLAGRGEVPPEGNFVDKAGNILGRHGGFHRYTLGQRRGLGVPAASRLFVTAIRPEVNEVVLSAGEDLYYSTVFCSNPNWISIDPPDGTLEAEARFRHSKQSIPVTVEQTAQGLTVSAKTPVRAPTPGQLAVFYHEDLVLGSAWIDGATP